MQYDWTATTCGEAAFFTFVVNVPRLRNVFAIGSRGFVFQVGATDAGTGNFNGAVRRRFGFRILRR